MANNKIELSTRETYLTYLAVSQALNGLMQYPDPLHEQHKIEYSQLVGFWQEALELSTNDTAKQDISKK